MPTHLYLSGDGEWDAEVSGDCVTIDGSGLVLRLAGSEDPASSSRRVIVTSPDGDVTAVAAIRGDVVWVSIDGHVFALKARHGGRRRTSTAGEDALSPPMSATVVRILVQPGAKVSRGDLLIALEAMKMELGIRAPRDGVVMAIHCKEGDLVQPGTPLLELA